MLIFPWHTKLKTGEKKNQERNFRISTGKTENTKLQKDV